MSGVIAALVVACAAPPAADVAQKPPRTERPTASADRCAEIPGAWRVAPRMLRGVFWPTRGAEDLVPPLDGDVCAAPTSWYLGAALNEDVVMSSEFRRGAYGILHRGTEALATFTVTEVPKNAPGFDQVMANTPGEQTQVGDRNVVWYSAGGHVGAGWVDENRLMIMIGGDADATRTAVAGWMAAEGEDAPVTVPDDLPEAPTETATALGEGLPTEGLPDGYTVLPIDSVMFAAADAADAVTIHDDEVTAIGGGIVLDDSGVVIATAVGSKAAAAPKEKPFSAAPGQVPEASEDGAFVRTVNAGRISILLVGHERERVEDLAAGWRDGLEAER